MFNQPAIRPQQPGDASWRLVAHGPAPWTGSYLRRARLADFACGLAAGLIAFKIRLADSSHPPAAYLALSLVLPLLWVGSVALAGGYDSRFIGVGSDEFHKIVNAGVRLTATVAVLAYAAKTDVARGYVVVALPCATLLDLVSRYTLRKQLHRRRRLGACLRRVVVVGHAPVVADLAAELRRESYHGLSVVAACLAGPSGAPDAGRYRRVPGHLRPGRGG